VSGPRRWACLRRSTAPTDPLATSSLTHLGGEHHQGGEPQSLDRASEPPASRIASDTGKAHAYAEGKLNGAGPGAGEKGGASSATAASDEVRVVSL